MVWNLLSNAVKFTPRNGRIEVRIARVDASLRIRVSDTGRGISPDFLPHVFERFRQQDGTSQRMQGGLGLGMAIVKELVELHGGTVQATSPGEGLGTTIEVDLPVPNLQRDPGSVRPASPEPASRERGRAALVGAQVLVVEDDPDTREMLVRVFGQSGARVSAVASAEQALLAIRRAAPDVIVCDIGLAGEDGHALIRKVRALELESGGRVPALALTAYAGPDAQANALAAGFDLQLAKPAVPAELVAQVALLVALRAGR